MVFDAVRWEMHIFLMLFNNSCYESISSILHRSARCMIPMVSRTCPFDATRKNLYFRCFLTIMAFAITSTWRIVLSLMVLDAFSKCHQFCIIIMFRNHPCNSRYSNFNSFFQWIFNVFVWRLFDIVFATLTKWKWAGRNMVCSKALMFTKRRWA